MEDVNYINITTKMFENEKLKLIDAMPEGDIIQYIWIRLLMIAGKTNANGKIFLDENIPYTLEMLSTIFNRPISLIKLAINTLVYFSMISIDEDMIIEIVNWDKYQNLEV